MKAYLKCICLTEILILSLLLFYTLIILLIVSCSEEEPLNITSTPIAKAGADQLVEIYDIVILDGSQSTNSENVEYIWTFIHKPPGSTNVFSDSSAPNPNFITDAEGFYNVQLVMKNKEMYSEPDFVVIQSILKKSEKYFPKQVGNKWKYKVTDSTGTVKDTVTVEIVGTTTLQNGETASIWVYNKRSLYAHYSFIDTLYLVTRADTLIYYQIHQNDLLPFLGYIVPFQVGDSWRDIPPTVTVLEYNSISIDIGTFQEAYQMKHNIFYLAAWTYNWIAPYVGLVKMDLYRTWSDGANTYWREEHWELIWYKLVE